MKNERVLLADDDLVALELSAEAIERFGEQDGHHVEAKAASVAEVESIMKGGLKPTVAIVDNLFPGPSDGKEAAKIIKRYSRKTFVISYSKNSVTWGQENWSKKIRLEELARKLTELQH